jgi:hypothetical protein
MHGCRNGNYFNNHTRAMSCYVDILFVMFLILFLEFSDVIDTVSNL